MTQALNAHLALASRFESIELAERALIDLLSQAGCDSDDGYWVLTALREAVANAVRHGNKVVAERTVRVDYLVTRAAVTIQVDDEGDGFDPTALPDPTDPARLLRPSGRGIFYMRQFMNRVEFSRAPGGGTRVTMVRQLQPESRSTEYEE